jgi:dipeptidyl aminopeptidase/acylaminoacyl peptidase
MRTNVPAAGSARPTIILGLALMFAGCGTGSAPPVLSPSPAERTNAVAEPTQAPVVTPTLTPAPTATATPTAAAPSPTSIDHSPGTGPWILYQAVYGYYDPVDLGLAKPDGSDSHRILGGPGNRWHPDWSPDGTQIAYDHNLPDESSRLGVISLEDGSDQFLTECIAPCMNHQAPAWSPDGQFIGFDGWEQPEGGIEVCFLARLELATGEITRMIEWPGCDQNEDAEDRPLSEGIRLRFSPDGERIVFQGEGPHNQSAIFIATVDGQDVERLTAWGLGARPDWSPDGEWIVFHSEEPELQYRPEVSLYRVRPDGTDLERLTSPGDRVTDVYPRYLPDGGGILFSRCLTLFACEARMTDPDGSNDRLLFGGLGSQTIHVMLQPAGEAD